MSLEQIGQKLKAAREAQGLSLRQIYERTKIPQGHLSSIDSAQVDDLPEPVYVAGYIKRYAECVGLDGQSLAEEYRRDAREALAGTGQPGSRLSAGAPVIINQPEYFSRNHIDRGPPTFKTFYFNAIWIVVVVGLLSYLVKVQIGNQTNQTDPSLASLRDATTRYPTPSSTPPAGIAQTKTDDAPPLDPGSQTDGQTLSPSTGDSRLTLSASKHVWVEVKSVSTGESKFVGYLEQGDSREFQDAQGLRVRAGNGGSLSVDFQGKIDAFGAPGKVTERTFMAQAPAGAPSTAQAATPPAAPTGKSAPATTTAISKTSDAKRLSQARQKTYRPVQDAPAREFTPDDSGTRSIDVPYRYSEGRLESE